MTKKVIVAALVVVVVFLGVGFIRMRRSHMMGGGSGSGTALVAVNASGTPAPVPAAAAAAGKLPANTAIQESGGLLVSLALDPYPPSVSQASNFDVTLADAGGGAVSDAAISLDLTMPGMWMPPNQLNLQPVSAGKYHANGHFTMRGLWRIEVIITRGGQKQSVFFDVGL